MRAWEMSLNLNRDTKSSNINESLMFSLSFERSALKPVLPLYILQNGSRAFRDININPSIVIPIRQRGQFV